MSSAEPESDLAVTAARHTCSVCRKEFPRVSDLNKHEKSHSRPFTCPVLGCKYRGPTAKDLERHVKSTHTRPYKCVFNFAGCESTFSSKNEWKRHVSTQHILLHYWICQEGQCSQVGNATSHSGQPLPKGAIFNRKDLYTQHMRRMHMPVGFAWAKKQLRGQDIELRKGWEDSLRHYQERAIRARCKLPEHLICPADGCLAEFRGEDAWNSRMEHVARHLDAASQGRELNVEFGGPNDEMLVRWASSPEVGIIQLQNGNWALLGGSSIPRGKPGDFGVVLPTAAAPDSLSVGTSTCFADSGYGSSIPAKGLRETEPDSNNSAQPAGANDDTAQMMLETYSIASTLEPSGIVDAYVSEFVEELRSALPPNLDREGWSLVSPETLADILKEFSIRVAHEETLTDGAACRMIMYLIHKYHRYVLCGFAAA